MLNGKVLGWTGGAAVDVRKCFAKMEWGVSFRALEALSAPGPLVALLADLNALTTLLARNVDALRAGTSLAGCAADLNLRAQRPAQVATTLSDVAGAIDEAGLHVSPSSQTPGQSSPPGV